MTPKFGRCRGRYDVVEVGPSRSGAVETDPVTSALFLCLPQHTLTCLKTTRTTDLNRRNGGFQEHATYARGRRVSRILYNIALKRPSKASFLF